MVNKRLQTLSKKLNEKDLCVVQNLLNKGIICKGFYIFDKKDHFRVWKDVNYLDFTNLQSVVDLVVNNSFIGEAV